MANDNLLDTAMKRALTKLDNLEKKMKIQEIREKALNKKVKTQTANG